MHFTEDINSFATCRSTSCQKWMHPWEKSIAFSKSIGCLLRISSPSILLVVTPVCMQPRVSKCLKEVIFVSYFTEILPV